jgi:allantoin racemase
VPGLIKERIMKILWIDPVGTDGFDAVIGNILKDSAQPGTEVDVISFPRGAPLHLEYHAYEGLVTADIVKLVYHVSSDYDGIVIGCFYDVGLREAREVSHRAVVTAPCQSSLVFASHLGNTFSILVGRKKWIPRMEENVRAYGQHHRLASMRPLELGVYDFQADVKRTAEIMLEQGRKAVEEDNAEVLILGCTIEFGFHETMQQELGVPVIDAVAAPFKLAEMLVHSAQLFHWYPSRAWGSEEPPENEIKDWGLFQDGPPIGNLLKHGDIEKS